MTLKHYLKVFDKVETTAVLEGLRDHGVKEKQIVLADLYRECKGLITFHKKSLNFSLVKRVRQGDTISSKPFTASVEEVFRKLHG